MEKTTEQTCCCGSITLRIAATCIGYLFLIWGLMTSASCLQKFLQLDVLRAELELKAAKQELGANCGEACIDTMYTGVVWCLFSWVFFNVLASALAALVLRGIAQKRPGLMSPFIFLHSAVLILTLLVFALSGILIFLYGFPHQPVMFLALCVPVISLYYYCIQTVRLHQLELLQRPALVVTVSPVEVDSKPPSYEEVVADAQYSGPPPSSDKLKLIA